MTDLTPIVLVHGLWHGSWCWSPVTGSLAARGVPSLAVDLEGHGLNGRSLAARWARPFDPAAFATEPSPSAAVTASSAAALLVEQIRQAGGGRPCVVVAHSMGGIVATAAAELAPELFAELIYVTAYVPVAGLSTAEYFSTPEAAEGQVGGLLAADPAAVGALRIDVGDRSRHAAMREVFYHDVDEQVADAAIGLLSPDAPAGIAGETLTVTAERYGSVPHTYVLCSEDRVVPRALQTRFVREIDAVSARPTTVVAFATSHSPLLSAPDALADVIGAAYRSRRPERASA
ncbi:alpha/beta fold hydrolase [Actinoplanes sp. M2I2]|uniref:alpha/beta fold hydrolase n=1 Tax=Actinoplanes sp. M2I2 TaxID=1734444 RepID=UPI00202202B1|nr:alpha/beta fold hydrolase [Actinoplanes sp. M2I2]